MNASEHPSQQGYGPPSFKDTKPDFTTNHGEPVILWNTRYLDAELTELSDRGVPVAEENVQRLAPLVSEHINMLGRYPFDTDSTGTQLRPFRNPDKDRES